MGLSPGSLAGLPSVACAEGRQPADWRGIVESIAMHFVQSPPIGAAQVAAFARRSLFTGLARWTLVAGLAFGAYCAVVAHEAGNAAESRYQDAGAHRSTVFTSPPNRRSIGDGDG